MQHTTYDMEGEGQDWNDHTQLLTPCIDVINQNFRN